MAIAGFRRRVSRPAPAVKFCQLVRAKFRCTGLEIRNAEPRADFPGLDGAGPHSAWVYLVG